eukprot:2016376-Pyramimonas_sp.AAC.1
MNTIRPMLPERDHKQYTSAPNARGIRRDKPGFTDECIERLRSRAPVDKPASRPSASVAKTTPDATGFTYDALPHADTPGIEDTSFTDRDYEDAGALGPDAARVLMKILYLARCFRFDMHLVCMLAREITEWTYACDKRLHRL